MTQFMDPDSGRFVWQPALQTGPEPTTWEHRMARRAAERDAAGSTEDILAEHEREEQARANGELWALTWEERAAIRQEKQPMTPEAAQEYLDREPIWCACLGTINCCRIAYSQACMVLGQPNGFDDLT